MKNYVIFILVLIGQVFLQYVPHISITLDRFLFCNQDKVQKYIIIALFCHTVNPIPLDKDDFIGSLEFLKPWAVKLTARQHSVDQRNLGIFISPTFIYVICE